MPYNLACLCVVALEANEVDLGLICAKIVWNVKVNAVNTVEFGCTAQPTICQRTPLCPGSRSLSW